MANDLKRKSLFFINIILLFNFLELYCCTWSCLYYLSERVKMFGLAVIEFLVKDDFTTEYSLFRVNNCAYCSPILEQSTLNYIYIYKLIVYYTVKKIRIYIRAEFRQSFGMNFVSPFQPEREFKVYKSCKCSQIICSRVH